MLSHRDRRCDVALAQKPPAPKGSPGEGRRRRRSAGPGNQPGLHRASLPAAFSGRSRPLPVMSTGPRPGPCTPPPHGRGGR